MYFSISILCHWFPQLFLFYFIFKWQALSDKYTQKNYCTPLRYCLDLFFFFLPTLFYKSLQDACAHIHRFAYLYSICSLHTFFFFTGNTLLFFFLVFPSLLRHFIISVNLSLFLVLLIKTGCYGFWCSIFILLLKIKLINERLSTVVEMRKCVVKSNSVNIFLKKCINSFQRT